MYVRETKKLPLGFHKIILAFIVVSMKVPVREGKKLSLVPTNLTTA